MYKTTLSENTYIDVFSNLKRLFTYTNFAVARVRASKASNSVYSVNFEAPLSDTEPPPLFGAKYNFHLEGVVDCPEFLVHFPTLIELADKHGLMLISQRRFDSYFNSVSFAWRQLYLSFLVNLLKYIGNDVTFEHMNSLIDICWNNNFCKY